MAKKTLKEHKENLMTNLEHQITVTKDAIRHIKKDKDKLIENHEESLAIYELQLNALKKK